MKYSHTLHERIYKACKDAKASYANGKDAQAAKINACEAFVNMHRNATEELQMFFDTYWLKRSQSGYIYVIVA